MDKELKDLIVGVVDNYDWEKIKYWANSIKQSGFDGYKALIVFNMDDATVKKLTDEGFLLVGASEYTEGEGFTYPYPSDRIMVDRFFYLYNFLKMMDKNENVNRVIVTDVRDVIFQDNPTTWLDDSLLTGYDMLVGSENLRYKDEPWGRNNLKASFGEYFYEDFKDEEIYCAGVIAGLPDALRDACLNLWLICRGCKPQIEGGGGPDQAAMNIMLDMVSYTFSTKFSNPTEGWVVHAGTSMPAIEAGSGGIGEAYKQNQIGRAHV